MRRIQKACSLSTVYKQWEEELELASTAHPGYNSSANPHYRSVVMNLFHCQGGLCAYTEVLLCSRDHYEPARWVAGIYDPTVGKPETKGQLEHFDSTLKKEKAWLWSNLFMVDTDINIKAKKSEAVDAILKPDANDYDPNEKLEYNSSMHMFVPKSDLPNDVKKRIAKMIGILGLNFDPIRVARKNWLMEKTKAIKFGIATWDSTEVDQFPTAFDMMRREAEALPQSMA